MCRNSYCVFTKRDQEEFLRTAEAPDFKVFWDWVVDIYPGIRAASTLQTYWRQLQSHVNREYGRGIHEKTPIGRDVRDVCYLQHP